MSSHVQGLLSPSDARPHYRTDLGAAFCGNALDYLGRLPDGCINLVLTSPPFALQRKKDYGNVDQAEYVDWFLQFGEEFHRVLTDDGSLVIDIGGSWTKGQPTRSLYHFELLIALCKKCRFHLAEEFYWWNPSKLPSPAQWVNVERIRVKDAVNPIWWLAKTPYPKADNRKVLRPYSKAMENLMRRGYNPKLRPSGHDISKKFGPNRGGAIPPNILVVANTDSNSQYLRKCRAAGLKPHPARFPSQIPEFFVRFLTDENDIVVDPFAGRNATGAACERLKRRWLSFELVRDYVQGSGFRFPDGTPYFSDEKEQPSAAD